MNELWQIIAELGLELHPDRVAAIASKIESLGSVERFALVKPAFGPNADKSMIGRLEAAWREAKQVRPSELAAALRGASATAASRGWYRRFALRAKGRSLISGSASGCRPW